MSVKLRSTKVIINGEEQIIIPGSLPGSPEDGHYAIDSSDGKLKVYNETKSRWIILGDAEDIVFDNSTNGFVADNVQDAIEELDDGVEESGLRQVQFQFIGQMNYDQYLIAGAHITSSTIRRSGDPSNGATYTNSAPQMSPIDGNIITVSINARGLAVSTGTYAATINLNLELWKVGQTGGEGTKLGDIVVAIPTGGETIGIWWNSSIFTAYGAEEDVSPTIAVSAGDLLGLKFKRVTGNSNVVSVDNLTVMLGIARS